MKTILYLLRHAATEANLAKPARLQGRRHNPALAKLGVRQAEVTRDFLAVHPIDFCFSSPLIRAVQTAEIVSQPHGITPVTLEGITECDVGRWEGLDWQTIQNQDGDNFQRFMANPGTFGYPDGESFGDVHERAKHTLDALIDDHRGQALLVVAHHVVNRTYLAGILGLSPDQARLISLENCGISVVVREGRQTTLTTLNAAFHLLGVAA